MLETEPQIIQQYIKPGRARLVYRHLLQLGAVSQALSEASECAGDQGRFWEMREVLYTRQDELYNASTFAALEPIVTELGLDASRFRQCFENGQFRQQVEADYAAAQREGVINRPVMDINGTRLVGALPFKRFQAAIDAAK